MYALGMANVTLFDTKTGNFKKVTIIVNKGLLDFLTSKGYTVTALTNV